VRDGRGGGGRSGDEEMISITSGIWRVEQKNGKQRGDHETIDGDDAPKGVGCHRRLSPAPCGDHAAERGRHFDVCMILSSVIEKSGRFNRNYVRRSKL
jgi:hypothetical protein